MNFFTCISSFFKQKHPPYHAVDDTGYSSALDITLENKTNLEESTMSSLAQIKEEEKAPTLVELDDEAAVEESSALTEVAEKIVENIVGQKNAEDGQKNNENPEANSESNNLISNLTDKVSNQLNDTIDAIDKKINPSPSDQLKEEIKDKFEEITDKAEKIFDKLEDKAEKIEKKAEKAAEVVIEKIEKEAEKNDNLLPMIIGGGAVVLLGVVFLALRKK